MKIGVLYGGLSSEREVSLNSGRNVAGALRRKGYQVVEIDVGLDICERLKSEKIDVAFVMLHGKPGEDGTVQGILEFLGIPYTGSAVLSSALAMDKIMSKRIFLSNNISTPGFLYPYSGLPEDWKYPVVVKPRSEGSSVGTTIAENESELREGIKKAKKFGEFFVEEYIKGMIATCGILGDDALPVLELVPKRRKFYDYKAKYTEGETDFIIPARIKEETANRVKELALLSHRALGCRHFSRVDFVIKDNIEPYVLEVNTIPGMTELSDLPKEARAVGIEYDELVERILKMAVRGLA